MSDHPALPPHGQQYPLSASLHPAVPMSYPDQSFPQGPCPPLAVDRFNGDITRNRTAHESKPRLSKMQHEVLEASFKFQNKPTTATKTHYADALEVPLDKINNWFQNRRAKQKQDIKKLEAAQQHAAAQQQAADQTTNPPFDSYQPFAESALFQPPAFPNLQTEPLPVRDPIAQDALMSDIVYHNADVNNYNPALQDSAELFDQFFGLENNLNGGPPAQIHQNTLSDFGKQFGRPDGSVMEAFYTPVDHNYYQSSAPSSLFSPRDSMDGSSARFSDCSAAYDNASLLPGHLRPYAPSTASHPSMYHDHRNSVASWTSSVRESTHHDNAYDAELRHGHARQVSSHQPDLSDSGLMIDTMGTLFPAAPIADPVAWSGLTQPAVGAGVTQFTHPLSLANRRQRRPSNLTGLGVVRTASYNAAVTRSNFMEGGDQSNIRRIKSSTGAVHPRLHMLTGTPARSPLRMTFDGTNIVGPARSASHSSGHGAPMQTVHESLIDGSYAAPFQPGTVNRGMADGAWPFLPAQLNQRPVPSLTYGASHVAPTPNVHPAAAQQATMPLAHWPTPFHTPSDQQQPFAPMMPMSMQYKLSPAPGPLAHSAMNPDLLLPNTPTATHFPTVQTPMRPAVAGAELLIHEYAPHESRGGDAAASGADSAKAKAGVPRTYTFANQGPEHFSSPDASVSSRQ